MQGSLNHPRQVIKNCQEYVRLQAPIQLYQPQALRLILTIFGGAPNIGSKYRDVYQKLVSLIKDVYPIPEKRFSALTSDLDLQIFRATPLKTNMSPENQWLEDVYISY